MQRASHRGEGRSLGPDGDRAGSWRSQRAQHARCITLNLRHAHCNTSTNRHNRRQSSDSDQTIFDTGVKLLKKALSQQRHRVRLIGIGVSSLTEPVSQFNMFDSSALRMGQLDNTIDRIRKKYGFDAIQTGRTLRLKDLFPTINGYSQLLQLRLAILITAHCGSA